MRASHALGRTPRVLSYGGGKDSFCMLVLAIESGELPDRVVFMDVGNPRSHPVNLGPKAQPAEWPQTYDHIIDVAAPLARRHGIPFHWILSEPPSGKLKRRLDRAGVIVEVYPIRPPQTRRAKLKEPALGLYDWFYKMGMVPAINKQLCTQVAKIERFNRWLAETYPREEVEVWIGFNADEVHRVERGKSYRVEQLGKADVSRRVRLPLVEANMDRTACVAQMRRLRLPVPVKSACVFCPFGKDWEWLEFFARYPGMFYQVVDLWERRGLTAAGYRMAPVFKKFELTPAQYALLKRLARRPKPLSDVAPRERVSFNTMRQRKWISKSGKPTKDGSRILAVAKRTPPQPGPGANSKWRREIVRIASGGRPKVGVHYDAKSLEEFIHGLVGATGHQASACFAEDPSKGALIAATALRRRARGNPWAYRW